MPTSGFTCARFFHFFNIDRTCIWIFCLFSYVSWACVWVYPLYLLHLLCLYLDLSASSTTSAMFTIGFIRFFYQIWWSVSGYIHLLNYVYYVCRYGLYDMPMPRILCFFCCVCYAYPLVFLLLYFYIASLN